MNDAAQAITRFEQYVQADPRNVELWIRFGDVLHRAGLFDRARSAFATSLELRPNHPVSRSRLASVELSRGNFATAEAVLRQLIAEGETGPAIAYNLALTLYYQQQFNEALQRFEELCVSGPHAADAMYYVVSCLHNLQREDEAIARCEAFLRQGPASPKLRGYLALVQMDAARMTEACEQARQVLSEQPDNTDAAAVLGTHAIEMQQMDEAENFLQVVAAREPNNVRGWQGLGLIALHREQHDLAVRHLERALTTDPANTGTITTLGWTHLVRHDYLTAEQTFRRGMEIDRNDAELHGGLATALVFQRRHDEARREIVLAFGLDKHCFGAVFARSILLRLDGREQLSTRLLANMFQRSVRADGPSLADALVTYMKRSGGARPQ